MTIVTVSETPIIIRADVANTVGPVGPAGPAGALGGTGSLYAVNTVSDLAGTSLTAAIQEIRVLGYHTVGVGELTIRRVNAQPAHPWKFRTADTYLANGSTDPTNGGWWEGVTLAGNTVTPEMFGAVADGILANYYGGGTDNYTAFNNMMLYNEYFSPGYANYGLRILLNEGVYNISQTIYVRAVINMEGIAGKAVTHQATTLQFPENTAGLYFYNNPATGISSGGSRIARFKMFAHRNLFGQPHGWDGTTQADAITCNEKVVIDDVEVGRFYGNGLYYTQGDQGFITSFAATNCGMDGIRINDHEAPFPSSPGNANAGIFQTCVLSGNGRCGVYEGSTLGNLHLAHEANGNGYIGQAVQYMNRAPTVQEAGKTYYIQGVAGSSDANVPLAQTARPSTNPSIWTEMSAGAGAQAPVWGQVVYNNVVYDVVPGQEANMWTSQPDTHPAVWTPSATPPSSLTWFYLLWRLNWAPYTLGGDYYTEANGGCNFINCYSEGANPPNAIPPNFISSGNVLTGGWAAGWVNSDVFKTTASSIKRSPFDTVLSRTDIQLGGDSTNGQTILKWRQNSGAYQEFKYINANGDLNFAEFTFLGANTTVTGYLGTDALPNRTYFPQGLCVTYNGVGAVQLAAARPDAFTGRAFGGVWGRGDVLFNVLANGAGGADGVTPFAWRCTTNSTGGTGAQFATYWAVDDSGRTVANLNALTGLTDGALAYATDALTPLNGCAVVGGGAVKVLCRFNGSSWVVVSAPPLVTTVTGLPAAATANKGARAMVTDSNATIAAGIGNTVANGGANIVPVYSDGTNWKIG